MTDDELAAIEARASAATVGPWVNHGPELFNIRASKEVSSGTELVCNINGAVNRLANAEFIAHSRQDVTALVDEVRRIRSVALHLAKVNLQLRRATCLHQWGNWIKCDPYPDERACQICGEREHSL